MNNQRNNHIGYIYDNTARVLQPVERPSERPERQRTPEKHVKPQPRQRRHPLQGLDLFSFLVLMAAMGITLYTCIDYLWVQSQITTTKNEIVSLENKIMDLQNENIAAEESIDSSLNLEEIYKKATKELGMVEATKGQVFTYDSTKSNMVKQYADIPKGDASESVR